MRCPLDLGTVKDFGRRVRPGCATGLLSRPGNASAAPAAVPNNATVPHGAATTTHARRVVPCELGGPIDTTEAVRVPDTPPTPGDSDRRAGYLGSGRRQQRPARSRSTEEEVYCASGR